MPSRRTLLRTISGVASCGIAGCTSLDRGVDGYVQLKSIEARGGNDQRPFETVLRVMLSSPPGASKPKLTHHQDQWTDRFDTPHRPEVSDALHEELTRAFDTVKYVIGICSPSWADGGESVGCINDSTTREDFNLVQVHDRVRASTDGASLSIRSVDGSWTFESG